MTPTQKRTVLVAPVVIPLLAVWWVLDQMIELIDLITDALLPVEEKR